MEVEENTEGGEASQVGVDSDVESSLCLSDNDDSISVSTESDIDYSVLREEVLGQIEATGDFLDDSKEASLNPKDKDKKQILPSDFMRVYNRLWRPRTLGGVVALSDSDTDSDYYNEDVQGLQCSVTTCRSRTHVKLRSRLVVSYYQLSHADSPRICHRCFVKAANFYKKIAKIGPNKCKFLINDNLIKATNTIEICDDDPQVPPANVKMIDDNSLATEVCKNIHQHVNNVAEKYSLETKYSQFLNKLEKKIGGMTVWINELNYKLGMDDGSIVEALQAVYKCHSPPRQGVRTVTVDMSIVDPDNPELVLESHEFEPLIIREPRKQLSKAADKGAIVIDSFSDPDVAIVEENTTYTRNKPNNLPPRGMVVRNKPCVGQMVYVSTRNTDSVDWVPAIIESIIINEDVLHNNQLNYTFKVAVGPTPRQSYVKEVKEDQMAYHEVSSVRIAVGNRIISVQHSSDRASKDPPKFSSGVVAESPSSNNQYRYMIMFESMAVQYSYHDELRVICEMKEPIHHYFPKPFQWFVRKYFEQLPRRKILTVNTMDIVKVEYNGRWVDGKVTAVDGLLMEVFYRQNAPTEWLYRGSPRVLSLDLYLSKLMKAFTEGRSLKVLTRGGVVAEHDPAEVQRMKELVAKKVVVQKDEEYTDKSSTPGGAGVSKTSDDPSVVRAVAKKTVTRQPDPSRASTSYPRILNRSSRIPTGISNSIYSSKSSRDEGAGWVHHIKDLGAVLFPRPRGVHDCSEVCIQWTNSTLDVCRGKNPLIIPMLFAFKRVDVTHMGGGASCKQIYYESPCGIKLEDFDTLLTYLQKTKCQLSVDYFDFDPWVNVWDEFQTPPGVVVVQDLSYGKEFNAIQVVNSIDRDVPPYMNYEVNRIATEGVPLNLDPDFLTCCDCTDDCSNKMTCPCWQKTIKDYLDLIVKTNAEIGSSTDIMDYSYIGYQNKRLVEYVPSGIYECNSMCKCSHTCLNRVVQLPLKVKLQLFKTEFKGWGTRCLNDIPAGGFICVYVGSLLTEKAANEDGKAYGDEYFAELDYIEVMERLMNKPGYESGPSDPEITDEEEEQSQEDTAESRAPNSSMKLRTRKKEKEKVRTKRSTNQSQKALNSSASDADEAGEADKSANTYKPLRHLYGNHESVYIIDAKAAGNIGRYFNHSCEPNIFVQNVFVDTHDLRFPWVAFFAKQHIRAGTELTWDYQYIVDSVPGKKLYCYCRTDSCRGRLL